MTMYRTSTQHSSSYQFRKISNPVSSTFDGIFTAGGIQQAELYRKSDICVPNFCLFLPLFLPCFHLHLAVVIKICRAVQIEFTRAFLKI